jgi:Lar family restriction alleviation protein
MRELKPCPFCGGTDASVDSTGEGEYDVTCMHCVAGAIACGPRKEDQASAITAWNTRTPSPVVSDEVVSLIARLENEPVLVADQEPFVELWEEDRDAVLNVLRGYAALKADNERMKEALTKIERLHPRDRHLGIVYARTILQEVSR